MRSEAGWRRTLAATGEAGHPFRGVLMADTSPRPTATPTPSPTIPAPRAGTDHPGMAASPAAPPTQRTAWAGWVGFAACMMFFVAAFQIVEGLVAIFDRT